MKASWRFVLNFGFEIWNFENKRIWGHPEYKADRQKQMLKSDSYQSYNQTIG
jgi:hypothetical protein